MSVLEKNSIDYIYVEDNHIIMGISDLLTWQEEAIVAHWQLLQDKLKNYIGFIKSGQLFEQYPEFDKQPCIKIFFSKKCPDDVDKYLNKLKKYYNELQCDLVWIYDPQED